MDNEKTNIEQQEDVGLPKTMEELQALLQREGDKRVTEAMKKADKKKADAIKEAERLAAMSAEEKYKYELDKREAAIAEKERSLALAENKVAASQILQEKGNKLREPYSKGLPIALVDLVVAESAETMNERIKGLESAFTSAVKTEVENRLKAATPKAGAQDVKPKNYAKMSLAEISAMMKQ